MDKDSEVHLSVIIPAYNEEHRLPGTLQEVLKYLSDQPYTSEILVVDDGSTDNTAAIVRSWCGSPVPVRLCTHPDGANYGKGAAVKLGMEQARGEFRLFMDADNSTTLDQIAHFWAALKEGGDVVIGSRRTPGSQIAVHQSWYKELAGRFGNWIIRLLAVPGISDTQAGFKMFTRRSAENLFPSPTITRWGCDVEMLAVARARGYSIREIPITWANSPHSRVSFGSYFQVLRDVWRVRRNLRSRLYG